MVWVTEKIVEAGLTQSAAPFGGAFYALLRTLNLVESLFPSRSDKVFNGL